MGPFWAFPGALDLQKTLVFLRCFKIFAVGPSFLRLRLSYRILRHLIFLLGPLGVALGGPFSTLLGPSWGPLGLSWGCPEPSWGLHAAIWGPSWGHLGTSWGHLGPPWGFLGALMGHLGAFLGHVCPSWTNLVTFGPLLEPTGRLPGPFRAHFEAILGSSWGHLGGML